MIIQRLVPFFIRGRGAALLAVSLGMAGLWGGVGPLWANGPQMPPPAVTLERFTPEDVNWRADYVGRVRGAREVEVRARVGGILEQRLYVEGQFVREGEALFRLDTEPFEIVLRQRRAELQNAHAEQAHAEREARRLGGLFERGAASERDRDRALTDQDLARARVAQAKAAVTDAERNLRYATVTAPIAGSTGLETRPEGSLIQVGDLLTVITQHDPVHVRFALPESDAAVRRLARQAMSDGEQPYRYQAGVILPGGEVYDHPGEVDFTNSTIDSRTGTVSARAVFPNPDGTLIPGQFVRIELVLQSLENVFLVDPSVVGQGPGGPQVLVVDEAQTAQVRPVTLGPVVDGRQVIIDGLTEADRVIVNGQVAVRDGMTVAPVDGE